MTLPPQSRAAESDDDRAMVRAAHTFAHYPLNPDLVARYRQNNYMAKYLEA